MQNRAIPYSFVEKKNYYEVRIGKQTVHANNVYSGKERQKIYISLACKLSELQVSGLPCPSS